MELNKGISPQVLSVVAYLLVELLAACGLPISLLSLLSLESVSNILLLFHAFWFNLLIVSYLIHLNLSFPWSRLPYSVAILT